MVSSARNPNESYAERARKASSSSTSRTTQQNNPQLTAHGPTTHPSSSLKPPPVNVWAERIKEQQAHATSQPARMSRQRAASSPQPPRDDPRSSPQPDLSVQLAILDQQDEHDPFVVRVPPHLSRQSSSSTNPLPVADPNAWPLPGAEPHSNASSAGYDSPFLSAVPSRQNSTASVRHHAYSPSRSVHPSRVQSSFSQRSRSASQSRVQSRSGSSASSPRLQIRGRALPQDDSLLPDLRLDHLHQRPSDTSSSPALPDPPNHVSTSYQIDLAPPPADPSYYQRPLVPPLQDIPPRYAHNFVPQYAPPHLPLTHAPGHTSPYVAHSGQGTPPYHHYPTYTAYMYGHPPFFWGDAPPHSQNYFQTQPSLPSNHTSPSEHAAPHKIEFGSISPSITTESPPSKHPAHSQNDSQPKPSRSVVFGTIDPADPQHDPNPPPPIEEQRAGTTVEHAIEQFATFSIGVSPDEPGPSRHASRKSSVKSLSRSLSSQPAINDSARDANAASPPSREVNGIKKPIKWEFGTTLSEDLDDPWTPSPPIPTSISQPILQGEPADDQFDLPSVPSSHGTSQADRSMDQSETTSTTSDVWVVKDYGNRFGGHSGRGNAPDVVRPEVREREKERVREGHRERETHRDQHRDKGWVPVRQPSWRRENGVEEGRGGWEQQQVHGDAPRHMRPRRGSFSGYGGHERGGFATRRGRGFGGRFHGGRGRGFFHHQRPGSYPYVPPPPPPPFEVLSPTIDTVNGYSPYTQPDLESYEAVPPAPQPPVLFTPATTYPEEAMRNYLLGQLEYYLSPQNMAQDFFLRQRMDKEGWVPISLLASFNRVRLLHSDTDTVRDVLSQSTAVELSGDWVRMGGRQWVPFVLPDAPKSVVTGADHGEGESPSSGLHEDGACAEVGEIDGEHGENEVDCDGDDCDGDDEDDDIVFVIGEEAEGSWMPVPERKP